MRKVALGIVIFFSVFVPIYAQQGEEITITTYYPSPVGVYNELSTNNLTLNPQAAAPGAQEGRLYYDNAANSVKYYDGTQWNDLGGKWKVSADNTKLYPNDNNWNVGIGTINPSKKLEVNGDAKVTGNIFMGYEIKQNPASVCAHGTVYCSPGKKVIGGGCKVSGNHTFLYQSGPVHDANGYGWYCCAGGGWPTDGYAICANIAGDWPFN